MKRAKIIRTAALKRKWQHISIRHLISFDVVLSWSDTLYPESFTLMEACLELHPWDSVFCRICSTSWNLVLFKGDLILGNGKNSQEARSGAYACWPVKYYIWPQTFAQNELNDEIHCHGGVAINRIILYFFRRTASLSQSLQHITFNLTYFIDEPTSSKK